MSITNNVQCSEKSPVSIAEESSINSMNQQNFKVASFMTHKLALWFTLLEIEFKRARIIKEESKFSLAVTYISPKYLKQLEEVIMNLSSEGPYECLKAEVLRRFTDSHYTRAQAARKSGVRGHETISVFPRPAGVGHRIGPRLIPVNAVERSTTSTRSKNFDSCRYQ